MPLPSRFRVAAASRFRVAAALLCAAVVASGCSGGADDAGTGHATLVDSAAICSVEGVSSALALADGEGTREGMANDPVGTAADNNPLLGDLVAALTSADLLDTLDAAESLTVFAPTDCAFAMADRATLDAALADPGGLLTQILGLHVIPGQRLSAAELGNAELETFTGQTVTVSNANGTVVLNGRATVVVSDIQTANATVHLVDTVLTPGSGGTTETAGPEVPGAPANSAEACDTATLIATIGAGPEQGTIEGMADDPVAAAAGSNPVLTTLVTALAQANLVDTLNTSEALTVFAPTDCAFATLDPGLLERALADPGGLLSQILGFHVVPGQRLSFEELTGGELPTINGRLLPVTAADGVVTLNGQARIVLPNIQTANATVHLIDTVMLPPVE